MIDLTQDTQEYQLVQSSFQINSNSLNHNIYAINKSFDYISFKYENLCYKNCKQCEKLKCLQCEGNLTTETYYQRQQDQEFDKVLGTCVDKTFYFQINQLDAIPNCQIGYYQNRITCQCQLCPKLNEYTCTECVYQTRQWIMDGLCRFQEFSQQQFIEQYAIEIISMNKFEKLYDIEHKINFENQISDSEETNQIFVKVYDPYQIYFGKCQKDYSYNFDIQKCFKKNKRNLQQFNYRNQIAVFQNWFNLSKWQMSKMLKQLLKLLISEQLKKDYLSIICPLIYDW